MANAKSMWRSFVVIIFASAIVALGAQELKRKYSHSRVKSHDMSDMVKGMHGNDLHARMSEGMVNSKTRKAVGESKSEETTTDTDNLSRGDRSELKDLLNKVMP